MHAFKLKHIHTYGFTHSLELNIYTLTLPHMKSFTNIFTYSYSHNSSTQADTLTHILT